VTIMVSGMGKSRLLDILAAPNETNDSGRKVKEQAITEFGANHAHDDKLLEFSNRISNAVGLCATFNGDSGRREDLALIPQAVNALSMRFLWGYFCNTVETPWTSFVKDCAGSLVKSISLLKTVNLILQDIGQDLDLIMCIDELMLAENGCPCKDMTDAARDILSGLVHFLDHKCRVHVVVSSLMYSSISKYLTWSQRAVMCISLPTISPDHYVNVKRASIQAWLDDSTELSGNMGGKVKDIVWQGLLDSGGHPRLLENVVKYFKMKSKKKALASVTLGDLHESLWSFSVARSCEASLGEKLLNALKYMCSCKMHNFSDLDPFISCGLLLQSANQISASYAIMPPLLIGMLYMHERSANEASPAFQILEACYQFMLLDTLASKAATAGDFFEKLSAHLLRLRLLLLSENKFFKFRLEDLLTVDDTINQAHWWNKSTNLEFTMPQKAVFAVSTVSKEDMEKAVKKGCPPGGAIYIAKDDQNVAFDILIHLPKPNQLIAIQSRYSKTTTESTITNGPVKKCLEDFQTHHPYLSSQTPSFVVLAFRKAGAKLSAQEFAGLGVKMSKACEQVAVLDQQGLMNIIPFSMRERPQLSSSSNSR
jgi:hypothetical protein